MSCLIFHKDGRPLLRYPIQKEKIIIGRDSDCDVILADTELSRKHCEIHKRLKGYEVKNLGVNGTYVNGTRVKERIVDDMDNIKIGDWIVNIKSGRDLPEEITAIRNDETTKIIKFDPSEKTVTFEVIELMIRSANGNKLGRKLKKPIISIGADKTNDVVISEDPYISKRHCRLSLEGNNLLLTDLGSTNGIFYEGEKIDKIALPKRSKFLIGKSEVTVKRLEESEKIAPADGRMGEMIGVSDSMREIFTLISIVAPTDAAICITGESGTGKELVARSIHENGNRASRPFVAINCGAIPANIIESELFGHEKGAFTGAATTHRGVFEQADCGTLFLDEICEMPPDLQTRLLRVLESKTIRRIGGQRDIPVDVRIVAATNKDLKQSVAEGKFREDLFFRLYIIPIHIPPLRERREDIESLVKHFINIFSPEDDEKSITPNAIKELTKHDWIGNVRELKNTIQRAVIMNKGGTITAKDISLTYLRDTKDPRAMPLISQEKEAILEALRRSGGNQSRASAILGIARSTLSNKIRKYDIDLSLMNLTQGDCGS